MGFDTKMLGEPQGQIKVGAAVCALIAFILTFMGDVCKNCKYGKSEELLLVFWWSLAVCMCISVALVVAGLFGLENDIVTQGDKIFHILGAILMNVISIMFLVRIDNTVWGTYKWWTMTGAFAQIYAILMAAYAYMVSQGS